MRTKVLSTSILLLGVCGCQADQSPEHRGTNSQVASSNQTIYSASCDDVAEAPESFAAEAEEVQTQSKETCADLSLAKAKGKPVEVSVDQGLGGAISNQTIKFTCTKIAGCKFPDQPEAATFALDGSANIDWEVDNWNVMQLDSTPIKNYANLKSISVTQTKKGLKVVVKFRKKPFPIYVSVEGGQGGGVKLPNGKVCSSSTYCQDFQTGVDEELTLDTMPLSEWEFDSWTVFDLAGAVQQSSQIKQHKVKQKRDGLKVKVKFRRKDGKAATNVATQPTCAVGTGRIDPAFPGSVLTTVNDLELVRAVPNGNYQLGCDLDLTGVTWAPIANFSGVLEGNNHKISNLTVNTPTANQVGFFASSNNAIIRNIELTNASVYGAKSVGPLVGEATNTTVMNVKTSGSIRGGQDVGGLMGTVWTANVRNSHTNVSVYAELWQAGGLIGATYNGSITGSSANANVTGPQLVYRLGGLVGNMAGVNIESSTSSGSVTGKMYVGGLVGSQISGGSIKRSRSTANVTAALSTINPTAPTNGAYAGGIVGFSSFFTLDRVSSMGTVTGDRDVGGIAGYSSRTSIVDSYSRSNVTGKTRVGGIAGSMGGTGSDFTSQISRSYAAGRVIGDSYVGGLVGVRTKDLFAPNSYWDKQTTGKNVSFAITNSGASPSAIDAVTGAPSYVTEPESVFKATGLNTDAFGVATNLVGFDFVNTWTPGVGTVYPTLRNP